MHPDVPVATLDLGERLGSGGQGEVFRVRNRVGSVFKRYHPANLNAPALTALVAFPGTLEPAASEALRRQAAWPLARVTDGPRLVGLLMREAPAEFLGRTSAGPKLRELQYLLYPRKPLWGDITPLDTPGRIEIAEEFVRLSRILQDHSVVMGDVSMLNVLWSNGHPPRIYLIDCDGFAVGGRQPVLRQPETPDWNDPLMPASGSDLDTDRYKIALLVGRVLAGSPEVRPGQALTLPGDIPATIAQSVQECFQAAAGPHGTRPDPKRWTMALRGRGLIKLAPAQVHPAAPELPKAGLDRSGGDRPRTVIQLPPAADPSRPRRPDRGP